jgi:hypothetical protein
MGYVWSYVIRLEWPYLAVLGLVTVGCLLWCAERALALYQQVTKKEPPPLSAVTGTPTAQLPASFANAPQLAGPLLRGLVVRIVDCAIDGYIRGKTFEDCKLYGPAVIAPIGSHDISFLRCVFDAPPEMLFWDSNADRVVGPIGMESCTFNRCEFHNIGFASSPVQTKRWLDRVRADVGKRKKK